VDAWTSRLTPFSRFFANSLLVSSETMTATTAVSILAGYALARFRFVGRDAYLVGYFESIPRELEESAMIDGCGRFGSLCRIVLPLAAPGIAATAIFAFVTSWSELLFSVTFTSQTGCARSRRAS
jgi:ABC-type glycerol-3-phosphate transport system permease component